MLKLTSADPKLDVVPDLRFGSPLSARDRSGVHKSLMYSVSAQVDIIPEAGHYPFLDQPLMFLEKVLGQTLRAFPDWQPSQHAAQQ